MSVVKMKPRMWHLRSNITNIASCKCGKKIVGYVLHSFLLLNVPVGLFIVWLDKFEHGDTSPSSVTLCSSYLRGHDRPPSSMLGSIARIWIQCLDRICKFNRILISTCQHVRVTKMKHNGFAKCTYRRAICNFAEVRAHVASDRTCVDVFGFRLIFL